ncbi:carboxylic acid reductase [Nocardia sp. alder85J]|uniref:carboxylic acid reductase n=1 Tax=Nocardia sp. alder85J TaxID=2862949 RepID=UPI001CD30E78|nr:carboxylic acid reductase [Nocardia sp. alder85J]MCX4097626.1 thioester reductase domain-containing protein [Nocardia sp. alder85J]
MASTWEADQQRRIDDILTDPQVRAALPAEDVTAAVLRPSMRLSQILDILATGYSDRPALGMRAAELATDESGRRVRRLLPVFDTVTYREMWSAAGALAAAWHRDERYSVRAGDFVAILGFTSPDYVVVDLACARQGIVAVPLQFSAPPGQWAAIVAETTPRVLATGVEFLRDAVEAILTGYTPEQLMVFDYHPEDDRHRAAMEAARHRLVAAGSPVLVSALTTVLDRGYNLPEAPLYIPAVDENPLTMLIYTSGSTGTPKGAMYTERMVAAMWRARYETGVVPTLPTIGLSYMPLSHLAGRLQLTSALLTGGTSYFAAASNMSTLFDDFELARPTALFFVPRVCDLVFQEFTSAVEHRVAAGEDRAEAERAVRIDLRERQFGGRVLSVGSGTAPLSAEMRAFVESVFEQPLHDGYGSTEAGGVLRDNRIRRPEVLDYKLVDVPELGYHTTDQPYPRGELLIKTMTMFPGYYKRPELSTEMFDPEGFYRTGDIMAETGPDELVYVDRRNNVLKLSQGEFVAVSQLEAVFATSALVRQIFVYGSSERSYVLAVVVPTDEAREAHPDDLKAALTESLQRIAQDAGLASYEIPRDLIIETHPFTRTEGLLSGVGKLLRPRMKERYGDQLEALYRQLEQQQTDELTALRTGAADRPTLATVVRAVRAMLGAADGEVAPDSHFGDLGGDSLSALSLSTLLREIFDVEVPVGVIVGPAVDLAELAKYIDNERATRGLRPTASGVHGDGDRIRATDLTLEKFLDEATLAAAATAPPASDPPRTVLLTGANGYLGRFLCLQWLERLDARDGALICLVRGKDAAAARARLDAAFDSGDLGLQRHYRDLARRRLQVLAGDIGEPNLGLSEQDWRRLAEITDMIVHPAALVNHVLPYDQLFGPNVVGTAEVLRMALTTRRKPVTYLSSVAVAAQIAPTGFTEDGDIRAMSPERALDDSYANGYGNSKWAGEVLLREAHDRFDLPVTVFRSDMILAHSYYAGQLNVVDMFTRLLLSILATGLAPKSFYRTDSAGHRQRSHYDGLPADFTAAAITGLGAAATTGYQTFDVLNPHDDGISLDQFVDWLIDEGHPIRRFEHYDEWFARFETALLGLPQQQRQQSVLPLLHAYRTPADPTRGSVLPADLFRAAVRQANLGPDGDIPHLTPALIHKYVTDLHLLKML